MNDLQKYQFKCTLTYGDIYGQIIIWLIVIFISLATALALWSSERQIYALATVGLILVLSLPFLLFAFVTTLFNHIQMTPLEKHASSKKRSQSQKTEQKPATSAG
jgi:hypothetical protein